MIPMLVIKYVQLKLTQPMMSKVHVNMSFTINQGVILQVGI